MLVKTKKTIVQEVEEDIEVPAYRTDGFGTFYRINEDRSLTTVYVGKYYQSMTRDTVCTNDSNLDKVIAAKTCSHNDFLAALEAFRSINAKAMQAE